MHNKPSSAVGYAGGVYEGKVRIVHLPHGLRNRISLATVTCGHDIQLA